MNKFKRYLIEKKYCHKSLDVNLTLCQGFFVAVPVLAKSLMAKFMRVAAPF